MQVRNSSIDAVRGIGILLVVLGHNWLTLHDRGFLYQVIFSFHMPLFFVLSGIFLHESSMIGKSIRSRSISLLKPYFVVLGLLGIAKYLAALKSGSTFDAPAYFLGVVWGTGPMLSWPQMWFLPNLFLSSILALMIVKFAVRSQHPERIVTLISIVLLSIGMWSIRRFWNYNDLSVAAFTGGTLPGLPWSLDLVPVTCAFILFGYLLRKRAKENAFNPGLFALAAGLFAALQIMSSATMDLNLRTYGDPFFSTTKAALGIYLVFGLAALLGNHKRLHAFFSYLGAASLFILIFHFYVEGLVFSKVAALGIRYETVGAIAGLILGLAVPLAIWEITKRQRYLALLLLPQAPGVRAHRQGGTA